MREIKIKCPCCDEKIIIQINGDGNPVAILLDKDLHSPTLAELEKLGIELGIVK